MKSLVSEMSWQELVDRGGGWRVGRERGKGEWRKRGVRGVGRGGGGSWGLAMSVG